MLVGADSVVYCAILFYIIAPRNAIYIGDAQNELNYMLLRGEEFIVSERVENITMNEGEKYYCVSEEYIKVLERADDIIIIKTGREKIL